MSRALLRIGEVARLLGVTAKTVRHYHKLGLLPEPERSEGGYRLYSPADLFHLRRIRQLQALGLSLRQIRFILDSDDPDGLLQTTLQGLQHELANQQRQIEERRQRIEAFLSEGVSLVAIEQPESPSPTYQLFQQMFSLQADLPETIVAFDKQVFAQLDAFNWGEGYTATLHETAQRLAHAENVFGFSEIIEKMTALQSMSEDDPQVQAWADELRASVLLQLVSSNDSNDLEPSVAGAMKHIVMQNVNEHLTPAQRRFFELLIA